MWLFLAAGALAAQETVTTQPAEPPIQIMGFADINYVSSDVDTPDGFVLGQAVAHVIAPLGERLNLFGEVSATGRDSEYNVEIERLIVRHDFSNRHSLSAGRYHSPIGYWNTAFHHGAWLQTTAGRPEMVRFGTPLVPIHFVGVLYESQFPGDLSSLRYNVGLGNGRHSNIARAGDAGDINGGRAWSAAVAYRPTSINGLNAGIGVYSDTVDPPGGPEVDEDIYSLHFAWERESPEIIAEYFNARHVATAAPLTSGDMNSFYVQVAYRLGGNRQQFKPYIRLERIDVDNDDPLLSPLNLDYEGAVVGVRFDFAPYASLKFEYHDEERGSMPKDDKVLVQLSFVLARN